MLLQLRTSFIDLIEKTQSYANLSSFSNDHINSIHFSHMKIPLRIRCTLTSLIDTRTVTARLLIMVKDTTNLGQQITCVFLISPGKSLKLFNQSAASDHLLECNCSIDFDHLIFWPSVT